jgi:spermidine synthase
VDYNPTVFDLAEKFFFRDFGNAQKHCMSAEDFVGQCTKTYDYICIDIWTDTGVPLFVASQDFWRKIKNILSPGGVVSVNANFYFHKHLCELATATLSSGLSLRDPDNCSLVAFDGERSFAFSEEQCRNFLRYGTDIRKIMRGAIQFSRPQIALD